jgi:adenosine kinase
VGAALATHVVETVGPQEYVVRREDFLSRLAEAYGAPAADDVAPHLP